MFNSEQSNQFYKLFSSMQNFGQFSPNISSVFLAYKGNYLNALFTISWYKISWIINYGAFDHMINVHHLFSTYSSYVGSFKVRVSDGSFLIVVGRWSIQISKFLTLKYVLYVPSLSCNLISISLLTKNSNCRTKFFPFHCVF